MQTIRDAPDARRTPWWRDGGVAAGLLGVICFSLSLPATRAAVPEMGAPLLAMGRAAGASLLGIAYLLATRSPWPTRAQWKSLALVAFGVVVGFPLFSSLALRHVPASHGAVITGLAPMATALVAMVRGGERPRRAFWLGCIAGVAGVLLFAASAGAGRLQPADGLLLLAVATVSVSYAEGGRLTRTMGGLRTISWTLVLGAPLTWGATAWLVARDGFPQASAPAWAGVAYLSVVSMFLGFVPWYHGLAKGGVARVSQTQLLQPLLTVGWAALLLGEAFHARTLAAAVVVLASAAYTLSQRAPVVEPHVSHAGEMKVGGDAEETRTAGGDATRSTAAERSARLRHDDEQPAEAILCGR